MASPPAPSPMRGLVIARFAGIELSVHGSWLLWLGLLTTIARQALVIDVAPNAGEAIAWGMALAFAVPLSACIVAHELAHALVARAHGLRVRRITLFLFGGVAQIEREAPTPGTEFRIALAGPLASLVMASVLAVVSRALNPGFAGLPGVWGTFAFFNLVIAVFNLVPAFPMDGGRILRSALWAGGRSRARATRRAAAAGRAFAYLLMGSGATLFAIALVGGDRGDLGGAWSMLIGWFLLNAATTAGRAEGGERPNG